MAKSSVLSGIQPTADSFHIGNYFGALRQWVQMQDTHECFYTVVDLHAITSEFDPKVICGVIAQSLLANGVTLSLKQ